MEEKDVQVSKFMKSMMNSNGVGWKENGKIQVDSDDEDSIWNCFTYMFKVKNLWIYAIFAFLSIFANRIAKFYSYFDNISALNVVLISIFAIIGFQAIYGYSFSFMKSLSEQQKSYKMPKFKFWQSIGLAIKSYVALIIMSVPLVVVSMIMIFLFCATTNQGYNILLVIFCLIMVVPLIFYLPAMGWLFANKRYWTSFVRFKELFVLINRSKNRYLDALGATVLSLVISTVVMYFIQKPYLVYITNQTTTRTEVAINNLFPIFLTSIICTYAMFVFAYISAKCISAKELDLNQDTESVS